MFSDEKDHERRSSEKHKDATHHSFIRHRIPYRLLGRRSLGAKRLVVSSKVLFPAIPTENCDVVLTFPANTEDATLMWLLARLKTRAPALTVHVRHHSHTGIYGFYLTALYENLLQGAEELGILKPLKSEYGGGMKEFVYEDQDCFAGVEEEASFLTSQERQNIVLHFLNELRATGDDSLEGISFIEGQPIVPLLITKKVISQVFPLHNHRDLKILRQTWVRAIFSRQPLDTVCQYFGVKIGLYFAYLGHYTTWLIVPALVGLVIFLLQGPNQHFDDLCFVGFALFNTVWATLYLKFWNRTSTEYCYRWGTLEKKDEMLKDPRPLFKGDLVKSPVTGHLELAYPAWKRLLFRYFVTCPVIAVCLALVFFIMLLCFELQEWVNELISEEELPYVFSFLPKVLLAVVVSMLDEVYKQIAIWLTHQENYRLEESHETSLVIKVVMFQFVNSFLSLFYIGFYLGDMDRLRDQLAALLITRQVLGNVKEALMPYVIWKARLYSVGYRIATRMSPASVEKEVRRMTTRPGRGATNSATKSSKPGDKSKRQQDASKNSDSESSPFTEEDDERLPTLTQAEVESAMKTYEDTLDDYLEMCIQFGYITLFSSAFPAAALCALLNNVIEIRSDAFKLCFTYQRPFGQRVESIGIWQDILLVMSVLAVIVNCALIGTSGLLERLYPGMSSTIYFMAIVTMEHLIISCKFALYRSIPDFPPAMATEMARLEYQRTEALKQLVSQMAPSQAGGNLMSHYPGSPVMRRKRPGESIGSEPNVREASPLATSTSDSKNRESSPTVITPTSTIPRPTDIFLESGATKYSELQKPPVPPRPSLQKSEPTSSQPKVSSSSYNDVAEKVVAAAMNPLFDSLDLKTSSSPSCTTAGPSSSSGISSALPSSPPVSDVPARLSLHPVMSESRGSSKIMRRVFRNRGSDLEAWRRRSEPVSLAVKQAISLHQADDDGDDVCGQDSRLKRKSIYANTEDLRGNVQDDLSRGREKLSLREENKKSRERLNILDNIGDRQTPKAKDDTVSSASSSPRVPISVTSLPPATSALTVSSSSLTSKYSPTSRLRKAGLLGSPSAFASKILSRKSRSFSSADVNEAKQLFQERYSWREDSPLSKTSSGSKSSPRKYGGKDTKKESDRRERQSSADARVDVDTGDKTRAPIEEKSDENEEITKKMQKSSDNISRESSPGKSGSPQFASEGHISESRDSSSSDNEPKPSIFKRAMRENASKPLSIWTKGSESKGKSS